MSWRFSSKGTRRKATVLELRGRVIFLGDVEKRDEAYVLMLTPAEARNHKPGDVVTLEHSGYGHWRILPP